MVCIVGVLEVTVEVVVGINSALQANLSSDVLLKIIPVPFMPSKPFPLHITLPSIAVNIYLMLSIVPDSNVKLLLNSLVHMILPPVRMRIKRLPVALKMKLPLASQSCCEVLH